MKCIKIALLLFVTLLIALRLVLPSFLLHYVERQINKIPEYKVKIQDLDVHLYRGSYTIKHLQLWKMSKSIPLPFVECKTIDLSVEWAAVLHGNLVAKAVLEHAIINFVTDTSGDEQLSIGDQWVSVVKSLFPLNINKLEVHNGEVYFLSYKGNPPFNTHIKDIEFTMQNMQNANRTQKLLSSSFAFTGKPMDGGDLQVSGDFNPFNKQPTFYLKGKLNSLAIRHLASLLKHYTQIDVVGGTFTLYGEVAAENGKIKGYVKPFLKNLKIGDPKKESPLGILYNNTAAVVAKVLENSDKKTIATKIKIDGEIVDPDTSTFSIISYLLRHAFIQALLPQIDHSIDMQDLQIGENKQSGEKIPLYKN